MKQSDITNPATLGDLYRAVYLTMWRMDRRHWRTVPTPPANDSGG